jgi:YbgC/YbaW family acyl-CoA thioester hydrolase
VPYEFRTKRRVEFAETDMAGIVHFAHFFRYMEMAEHEFLRSLGLSVHAEIDGRVISWPRVKAECSYRSPVRFEDVLGVHLVVREKKTKTISYDFRFLNQGKLVAEGSLTVVCVAVDPVTRQMSSVAIPEMIDEKIEAAPPEVIHAKS